jgi:hypothetical protein
MLLDINHILESPWPLLTVAIILLAIVVVVRQTWPYKRRWWQLLLPLILAVAAVGLDRFVETDYEKIESVIDTGIRAVIAQDLGQIDRIISPDYADSARRSKAGLMAFCGDLLSQPLAERIKKLQEQINVSGQQANAEVSVRVHLQQQNVYATAGTLMFVKMKLYFAQVPYGKWLISRVEVITVNNQPLNWGSFR